MAMDTDFYIKIAAAFAIIIGMFVIMPIMLFRGKSVKSEAPEADPKPAAPEAADDGSAKAPPKRRNT